jgi:hypothetical protein
MATRIAALEEEKRHNVACVKWIANAFCDEHGNPRTDMPLWAHAVTDTLLLGLTPADAVVAQMELEPRASTRQPVAWWIGPHDGLMAGATVNKSLADARIEHGATVRPLVFGDVAPEAKARVTDAMVLRAESAYDAWISANEDSWNSFGLCSPDALRAALEAAPTGGATDGE